MNTIPTLWTSTNFVSRWFFVQRYSICLWNWKQENSKRKLPTYYVKLVAKSALKLIFNEIHLLQIFIVFSLRLFVDKIFFLNEIFPTKCTWKLDYWNCQINCSQLNLMINICFKHRLRRHKWWNHRISTHILTNSNS